MDSSIALTLIVLILIVGLNLCHTVFKKIVTKPEFEDEALQILNKRWQLKQDVKTPKEEKALQYMILENKADELVLKALKSDNRAKVTVRT